MKKSVEDLIEKSRKKDTVILLNQQLADATKEIKDKNRLLELYQVETNPITEIKAPRDNTKNYATALSLLSDFHAEEKVTLMQTNGRNKNTPTIAEKKYEKFFINLTKRITKNQKDVRIDELVLGILGDLIHGFIHEEYIRTNYLTPIEAMLFTIEQLEKGFRYLDKNVGLKRITVVCKVGNHSRTTFKPFIDEEATYSYEYGAYRILQKLFPHYNWIIQDNYFTYLDIYNIKTRFSHGHRVNYQGGVGGVTIPLNKHRLRSDQTKQADLNCIAHFHTAEWSRNTKTLLNGSGIGFNAYAISKGYEPEDPIQQFLLIDSKRGATVNEPILLT